MASMSSISVALSGLQAAQANLAVTGHNVSNVSVTGYTRQHLVQQDFSYRNLGASPVGSLKLQAGLGTSMAQIRQLRNKFLDAAYRQENSSGSYYARKFTAGDEVNTIIGELQSKYKAQDVITDIWNSINEMSKEPAGIQTRQSFIQSCLTLIDKMQDINKSLFEYQLNLNEQVKQEVTQINKILEQIGGLNQQIENIEADGSRANDLRDIRNNLLDELSGYLDIEVKETAINEGNTSRIEILFQGNELLVGNIPNKISLRYCNGKYPFVEPVFADANEILPATDSSKPLFPNLNTEYLGTNSENTKGSLKGLVVSRGTVIGNYTHTDEQVGNYLIPEVQRKIDTLMHEIIGMLNEASTSGVGLDGEPGVPIFIRKSEITGEIAGDVPENPNDFATLFTLNNVEINPVLLESQGYNKLGFSRTQSDESDNTILQELIVKWKQPIDSLEGASVDNYYKKLITDFAVIVQEDREKMESKIGSITLADNKRMTISAVSLDEELSNMLKYQHAYNSAAKIVNVIDGMMDRIINGTGRVGI